MLSEQPRNTYDKSAHARKRGDTWPISEFKGQEHNFDRPASNEPKLKWFFNVVLISISSDFKKCIYFLDLCWFSLHIHVYFQSNALFNFDIWQKGS